MKILLGLLLVGLLLGGCARKGGPKAFAKAMAQRESYSQELENALKGIPNLRERTKELSEKHRAVLASQGKKLTPDQHKTMVEEQTAKLPDLAAPQLPEVEPVDLKDFEDDQQLQLLLADQLRKMLDTQLPVLSKAQKKLAWLEQDLARLEAVKPAGKAK